MRLRPSQLASARGAPGRAPAAAREAEILRFWDILSPTRALTGGPRDPAGHPSEELPRETYSTLEASKENV